MTAEAAAAADPAPAKLGHHPPAWFPAPLRALAAVSRAFAVAEGIGIGVCLVCLVALATFGFVSHNLRERGQLWFPSSPGWADGVIRHSVFLLGFLGAAFATFTGRHIRIDAITRMVAQRGRLVLRVITTVAAIAICLVLVRCSAQFLEACRKMGSDMSEESQLFTSARGAMLMVGGFALIAFHFFVQLLFDVAFVVTGRAPPPLWISEASHADPPMTNQEEMTPPPHAAVPPSPSPSLPPSTGGAA